VKGKFVDTISLYASHADGGHHWQEYGMGDPVDLEDGIYIGAKGTAVVYEGALVVAWDKPNQIVPHGSPRQWSEMKGQLHIDDAVAHITMESLKEASRKEHLNWEDDCLPRIKELIDLVVLQIEPIHMCMIACNKLRQRIKKEKHDRNDQS